MTNTIPNEAAAVRIYAGTEDVAGVPVTPNHQWLGMLTATKTQDLRDREEATGGYHRDVTPALGLPTFAGTYAEDMTFEMFMAHMRYALKRGDDPVSGDASDGYWYEKSPSFAADDIASATLAYGVDGMPWRSHGVRHNEVTITIDVDDDDGVWKLSSNLSLMGKTALPTAFVGVATGGGSNTLTMTGAGWEVDELVGRYVFLNHGSHVGQTRLIASNTATEITVDEDWDTEPDSGDPFKVEAAFPVISIPGNEDIPSYGTNVFLDPIDGDIGETMLEDRVISLSITIDSQRTTKRFLNNPADEVARKTGRGKQNFNGQLRLELDRRDEYEAWQNITQRQLRVQQFGSFISGDSGPRKEARIDLPKIAFSTPTEDNRENNLTITVPFKGYLPEGSPILTAAARLAMAQLP